jgi:hypothetical protein
MSEHIQTHGSGRTRELPPDRSETIAEWRRETGDMLRLCFDKQRGKDVIDLRWWRTDPETKEQYRTKYGVALSVIHLPAIAAAFSAALVKARERGLLPPEPPKN